VATTLSTLTDLKYWKDATMPTMGVDWNSGGGAPAVEDFRWQLCHQRSDRAAQC